MKSEFTPKSYHIGQSSSQGKADEAKVSKEHSSASEAKSVPQDTNGLKKLIKGQENSKAAVLNPSETGEMLQLLDELEVISPPGSRKEAMNQLFDLYILNEAPLERSANMLDLTEDIPKVDELVRLNPGLTENMENVVNHFYNLEQEFIAKKAVAIDSIRRGGLSEYEVSIQREYVKSLDYAILEANTQLDEAKFRLEWQRLQEKADIAAEEEARAEREAQGRLRFVPGDNDS